MSRKTALVAGGTGIIGQRIVEHLLGAGEWDVIALARRPRNNPAARWIAVDLTDPGDTKSKLGALKEVTHIFYAARRDHEDDAIDAVDLNTTMFSQFVTLIEPVAKLQHVHAIHGSKYYGFHIGPVPYPVTEESPRANFHNFYYEQEDFLRSHSQGKAWTYSTSRPHVLCDGAIDYRRSIGLVIWVYAMVQRELGLPLDFPGTASGFQIRMPFTDTGLLARCIVWMSEAANCANQAFNVVNDDRLRWADLWPRFAAHFGMQPGVPENIRLADYLSDKGKVWDRIVERHRLRAATLDDIAWWEYGDRMLRPKFEFESVMAKARAYGFAERLDSTTMFLRHFAQYEAQQR